MTQSASPRTVPPPSPTTPSSPCLLPPPPPPLHLLSPLDRRQDGHRKSGTEYCYIFIIIINFHLTRPCLYAAAGPSGCGRLRVYIRRPAERLCGAGRITDRLTRCVWT